MTKKRELARMEIHKNTQKKVTEMREKLFGKECEFVLKKAHLRFIERMVVRIIPMNSGE
jgi:hypothetical protein